MASALKPVAFPLILPWRPEFWTLPLYFPELQVGVLWQWPPEVPYRGMELPAQARSGAGELRHYAPGELRQWRAVEEARGTGEELDDLVRALKGEPPPPPTPEGPWQTETVWSLAWQVELSEAEQEAHLVRVEQRQRGLTELLAAEPWEEPGDFTPGPDLEVLDPETAALRYRLWRRELDLQPGVTPLLLSRSAEAVFLSLRREAGGREPERARLKLPGCRSLDTYLQVRQEGAAPPWLGEFSALLRECLRDAGQGQDLEEALESLKKWIHTALHQQWPEPAPFFWELELWSPDPHAPEGGEALLAWGGLGKTVVPG